MHPLHTPEILEVLKDDRHGLWRRTGRSTILALEKIVQAIKNPGVPQSIADHHSTVMADMHLGNMIRDFVSKLGLMHLHVERDPKYTDQFIIVFERRTK